ncbi:hypothetical protein NC653_016676 [Populus alba x Populus x berolinensis]|uniref:Uncharacterized protein n=1 Tax=Populus alba x Populus x berolinensis TaxID=444605 RepID=A0AAD6QNL4_9ROSI|nr:hypothetical protein NC653_016676 [Populus alba x Populus x berolinensis]
MEPIRFLWITFKSHASYVFFFLEMHVQETLATDINGLVFALARMTIPDSIAAAVCILCCTRKQQYVTNGRKLDDFDDSSGSGGNRPAAKGQ